MPVGTPNDSHRWRMLVSLSTPECVALTSVATAFLSAAAYVLGALVKKSAIVDSTQLVQHGTTDRERIRAENAVAIMRLGRGQNTTITLRLDWSAGLSEEFPDAAGALTELARQRPGPSTNGGGWPRVLH